MATQKQPVGSPSSLTVTGLSTLASATYVQSNTYTANTNQPLDIILQVDIATTNTPSGNKQVKVFVDESLDGTDFRTGPTSSTTTTREGNHTPLGIIPLTTASTTERAFFSVKRALGFCPHSAKFTFFNDAGVALTSATVKVSEISGTVS